MKPNKTFTNIKGLIAMISITILAHFIGLDKSKGDKEFLESAILLIFGMIVVGMLLIASRKGGFYCDEEGEL